LQENGHSGSHPDKLLFYLLLNINLTMLKKLKVDLFMKDSMLLLILLVTKLIKWLELPN